MDASLLGKRLADRSAVGRQPLVRIRWATETARRYHRCSASMLVVRGVAERAALAGMWPHVVVARADHHALLGPQVEDSSSLGEPQPRRAPSGVAVS